jgi:glucose/arabinose dehydrogenase
MNLVDVRCYFQICTIAALAAATAAPTLSAATLPAGFSETQIATGISAPTAMTFAPDGRIFVCQQGGSLRVIKNGILLATPFVTLTVNSSGERGLLGVAFDPNFASNQYVYVYYTATTPAIHNRISRFTANGDVALPGSEVVILELNNLSGATNHNGGAIHFGPDGRLYAGVGENANGPNAQTLNNLLGKILRLNPDGTIPEDNPFYNIATGNNRAIWALGLRNPFTFAFQPGTGRMFINDVGQDTWEEINDGIPASNYGWPDTEGPTGNPQYRSPLFYYGHGDNGTTGCAIAGGAFYNPSIVTFPIEYLGDYFFADFCSGWIRRFDPNGGSISDFAMDIASPVDLMVGPDGSLYYLARGGGGLFRIDYAANIERAQMTTPTPGSTFTSSTETFTWSAGIGVSAYWLEIGTTPGGNQIYPGSQTTSLSATVSGLPANGTTLYVRLWSLIGGAWVYEDYTYTAAGSSQAKAVMVSPTPGSTLTSSTVAFIWNAGSGVSAYWLEVGTTPGGNQIYPGSPVTNLSATVSGLPTNGSTVYVRLWSLLSGAWQSNDYIYTSTTAASGAVILSPTPGSTLASSTVTFTWSAGSGVSAFWLEVGTALGGNQIYPGSPVTNVSATVFGLPGDGSTVYVRLWSLIGGAWQFNDYIYTSASGPPGAVILSPTPGSTLTSSAVTFTWSAGSGVSAYWLEVGTTPGGNQIYPGSPVTELSATVFGLPGDGSTVYVRLWSLIGGAWQFNDYTYTSASGPSGAAMISPTPGSTLISSAVTFTWSPGSGVSVYWLEVGTTQGGNQIYPGSTVTQLSATVFGLPTNGSIVYVRLWSLIGGVWHFQDYVYTAAS